MAKKDDSSGLEPMPLALILCDHVHIDPQTGRSTILGIFHGIEATEFPLVYPKLVVYAALTDGRGTVPVTIRLVDVDEAESPLWSETWDVEFTDPWEVEELSIEVFDVRFENPGIFRLQLLAWNATIIDYTVSVRQVTGE